MPWEDEKFVYIAASRQSGAHPDARPDARIIAPPWNAGNGRIGFKLCSGDGTRTERILGKRDGAAFKTARRLGWGDGLSLLDSPAA